jgi:hypothetical protein
MSAKQKLSEEIWEKSSGWVDQIGVVIGKMAEQLGVASEHVYTVYTKQIFFEGIVRASFAASFVLVFIVFNIYCWYSTRNLSNSTDDFEAKWGLRAIAAIILFVVGGLIVNYGVIPNMLKALNPEYYTIKEIIDQVGKLVE